MKKEFEEWVGLLSAPHGILTSEQLLGRKSLIKLGVPNKYAETWRLTNLKKFQEILKLPISQSNNLNPNKKNTSWPFQKENSLRIILNSDINLLKNNSLPKGIKILEDEEIKDNINLLEYQLDEPENWCLSVNQASSNQILALKIDNVEKVSIEILIPTEEKSFTPNRILIILEKKAQLDLVQIIMGEEKASINNIVQILMKEESEVNHGLIALGEDESSLFNQALIHQSENSNYSFTSIQHGWTVSRIEPRIYQKNGKAKTTLKGLQISNRNQQLATHSFVQFNGPEGTLNQLQKSIATDKSHCIFNGAVQVPQKAQKTNASQLSRNLLISDEAQIDTKPELEIVADDVKCTHGATVSQLQEEELFYLRSRGIDIKQATSLLLKGYCYEIIDSLPNSEMRSYILNQIIKNLNK